MFFGENQSKQDSIFESLAATPPMGWNSWNKFGCDVNENLLKQMADAIANSGMKDAGYQYIVIDIHRIQNIPCSKKLLVADS